VNNEQASIEHAFEANKHTFFFKVHMGLCQQKWFQSGVIKVESNFGTYGTPGNKKTHTPLF
jgi:hypothetical protein